jgi:hypothetical protein
LSHFFDFHVTCESHFLDLRALGTKCLKDLVQVDSLSFSSLEQEVSNIFQSKNHLVCSKWDGDELHVLNDSSFLNGLRNEWAFKVNCSFSIPKVEEVLGWGICSELHFSL